MFTFFKSNWGKNVVVFGVDNILSAHVDGKKKDILVLCEDPSQGLDDTMITVEAKYFINFSWSQKNFCLSLHYNGSNSFLFVNATKIYQIIYHCIGHISKDF